MSTLYKQGITNAPGMYADILAFLTGGLVGFTNIGQVTSEAVVFDVLRIKNIFNSAGASNEEYAYLLISDNGGNITIGTCRSSDGATLTGALAVANMSILSGVTFPSKLVVTASNKRVCIGFLDSVEEYSAVFWNQVNFSTLDAGQVAVNATHKFNMENNLQVVGELGGSLRILYAGHGFPTLQTEFDQPCELFTLAPDETNIRSNPTGDILVGTAMVKAGVNEFYGILDGTYMTKTSVLHLFDKPSQGNIAHRFFRDRSSNQGIIVKETV